MVSDSVFHQSDKPSQRKSDAYVDINIAEDAMTVFASFYPPINEGKPLHLDDLELLIQSYNIVNGVDWDRIQELILQCNGDRKVLHDQIIAKGTDPEDEIPAYIHLDNHLFEAGLERKKDSAQIDYKEISAFTTVNRGEILGKVIPKKQGIEGSDIYGSPKPYGKKERKQLKPGNNVALKDGKALSKIAGRFLRNEEEFWIENILELKGDIDYSTGHINFPGDVSITGDVRGGFHIRTTGNFLTKGLVEASQVEVHGDFTAGQGIVGRRQNKIRVGKSLKTKFGEGINLECNGDVIVKSSLYSSRVYTLGHFVMGKSGKIVNSLVQARQGVQAAQIGNAKGVKCKIIVGVDFVIQKKIHLLQKQTNTLNRRVLALQKIMQEKPSEKYERIDRELKKKINIIVEKIPHFQERVFSHQDAEIICTGILFPGVELQIGEHVEEILEKAQKVHYHYDKMMNKIVQNKIGSESSRASEKGGEKSGEDKQQD